MTPLVAVGLVAGVAGALTGAAVLAWPRRDLGGAFGLVHATERAMVDSARWRRLLRARLDPARSTGLALTVASVLLAGGAATVGVVLAMVRSRTGLERWDLRLARWGAEHGTAASTGVLSEVTRLGGTHVTAAVVVVAAVAAYRRTRSRAPVGFLALAFVGQNVVVNVTKWLVDRGRPDIDRLTTYAGASFPSAHSATAATTYAAVALLAGWHRSVRVRAVLAAVAVALTTAVAGTRVVLGVHWFTDVVAGVALGWGWFALCAIAFGGRILRFGAPVEVAERVTVGPPPAAASATAPSRPGRPVTPPPPVLRRHRLPRVPRRR